MKALINLYLFIFVVGLNFIGVFNWREHGKNFQKSLRARGKVILRKKGRIIYVGASITYIENSILIMKFSYLGGCETLETQNLFLNPSI